MLTSVTITAADLGRSRGFYDAVLGAFGWTRVAELVDEEEDDAAVEALGWAPDDGPAQLWLVSAGTPTTGLHVRLGAKSRVEVETCAAMANQSGGRVVAAPRRWTIYRRGEFGTTVADPDGNLLEIVAPE